MADSPPPMDFEEGDAPAEATEDFPEPLEDAPMEEEPTPPATLPMPTTEDSDDLFADTTTADTEPEKGSAAVLEPSSAPPEEQPVQSKPVAPAATDTVDLFDDDSTEEPQPKPPKQRVRW